MTIISRAREENLYVIYVIYVICVTADDDNDVNDDNDGVFTVWIIVMTTGAARQKGEFL